MNIDDLLEKVQDDIGALESFCDVMLIIAKEGSELYNFALHVKGCAESLEINLSNLACAIVDSD